MNDTRVLGSRWGGTATVLLLVFLLFYLPSVLNLLSNEGEPAFWTVTGIVMASSYTLIFCINYFKLVPWLLIRGDRKTLYFSINFCLILIICCLVPLWLEMLGGLPMPKHRHIQPLTTSQYLLGYLKFVLRDSIMMILSAALAYAMRLSNERERLRRRNLKLNAEKRQIELKSLKAQLNPHFLFNSLNNIYALIGFAPDRAQMALHDLSSMLRFMIYDSGASTVPLQKEIKFITDYTALMKLRLNDNISVKCDFLKAAPNDIQITPLLFLTLVENAFKHVGVSDNNQGFIRIEIGLNENNLTGTVSNSYNDKERNHMQVNPADSGVGIENVRRQLELLYPNNYQFNVDKKENVFTASITINKSLLTTSSEISQHEP